MNPAVARLALTIAKYQCLSVLTALKTDFSGLSPGSRTWELWVRDSAERCVIVMIKDELF